MSANSEMTEAETQEMRAILFEMKAVLASHRISHPKMFLGMLMQAPVFISLFVATREVGRLVF